MAPLCSRTNLRLLCLSLLLQPILAGFSVSPPCFVVDPACASAPRVSRHSLGCHIRSSLLLLASSAGGDDDPTREEKESLSPGIFNPFAARDAAQSGRFGVPTGSTSSGSRTNWVSPSSSSSSLISVRKMQMQQVLSDMMAVWDDAAELRLAMEQHREVILAPFVPDGNFVDDDPDTIYTTSMTPLQRFEAYQDALQGRIQSAKNPSVRTVLQAMKEYVAESVER